MMKLALAALLIGFAACGGGNNGNVIVVDTPDVPMLCDPRAQTGCAPGEKCATRVLQETATSRLTEIACVPDGTVAVDAACRYGLPGDKGFSDCKAGAECIPFSYPGEPAGTCKQICDHQGGPPRCGMNFACSSYEDLFQSSTMTVAGVCDPKCDPLTQALLVGTTTAACGSVDPAMPDQGCYTFDLVDWTCAGIPTPARTRIDRMPGYGPPSGGVYVNGCAAGYIPLLIQESGSMVGICSGVCAPAPTDNTQAGNAKGDMNAVAKLHTKAMPEMGDGTCEVGKKGSEANMNCQYMWFWNRDQSGNVIPSDYNNTTGLCFGYDHYTVDHDRNPATQPEPWPKCESLPPMGTPADPVMYIYGNADRWGCVPRTTFTNDKAVNPIVNDIQVGGRPGVAVRHILRQ